LKPTEAKVRLSVSGAERKGGRRFTQITGNTREEKKQGRQNRTTGKK